MAISFDGPTKVISLSSGTTTLSVRDLWSRWIDWLLTNDNSKYPQAMDNVGGDDLGGGNFIPIYVFLLNGWRIKPQEASHTLNVNDGILLVDGGGDPFVNPDGDFVVRINYQQPVSAISFSSEGNTGPTPAEIAEAVWAEMSTNYNVANSFGALAKRSIPTAPEVGTAVWADVGAVALIGDVANIQTDVGELQTAVATLPDTADVVTGVWGAPEADALQTTINSALDVVNILLKYQKNRTRVDASAKTLTVYDDDNLTPLKVFNLKDFSGAPSYTEVAEKRPA